MLKRLTYLVGLAIACVAIVSTPASALFGKKAAAPATAGAPAKIKCPTMIGGAGTCTAAYCGVKDSAHFVACSTACGKGKPEKNIKVCHDAHMKATGVVGTVAIKCPSMMGGAGTCTAAFCGDSLNYTKCNTTCGKGKPEKNIKACYTAYMNKGGQNAVAQASAKNSAADVAKKKAAADAAAKAKAKAAKEAAEAKAAEEAAAAATEEAPAEAPPPEEAPADAPPPEEAPAE